MAYRVVICEDSLMTRTLLEKYINESPDYMLIASVSSDSISKSSLEKQKFDLLLIGALTASGTNGFIVAEKIKRKNRKIKIIVLSSIPEMSFLQTAKKTGVDSFCFTEINGDKIISVMDRTVSGEKVYPKAPPNVQIGLAKSHDFTEREIEVLRELLTGENNGEIARHLHITSDTVKYHIAQMLQKTGFQSRTELAVEVSATGIVARLNRF